MVLLDFINSNPCWEGILSSEPYNLSIRKKDDYILLKYSQLDSDMSLPECQEARGIIFKKTESGYECVCHPFDKFFNYGEENASSVDWESASVLEKVDGSLIKFFYDNGWKIATNGCIDADDATIPGSEDRTFRDLVCEAVPDINAFVEKLDRSHTYMFELVSPESELVVRYPETAMYYLGERDNLSDKEMRLPHPEMEKFGIKFPECYHLNSLKDVCSLVNSFTADREGCVVCDKNFNRIKVKGEEYLKMFYARAGANKGTRGYLRLILDDSADDFVAYNPNKKEKISEIETALKSVAADYEKAAESFSKLSFNSRKDMAACIFTYFKDYSAYLFARTDGKAGNAEDYVMNKMSFPSLLKKVEKRMEENRTALEVSRECHEL